MQRKEYWNEEYLKYWKQKVSESNGEDSLLNDINNTKAPSDDISYLYFKKFDIKSQDKILDFGCGYGRSYSYFEITQGQYYGIDISNAMIQSFKEKYPQVANQLHVAEGENLPFENNFFNFIVCFGVFDACYQEEALFEMLRVLKHGGNILLTGKNFNYCNNDTEALIAEEKAREKKHPNYFTDVNYMIQQLLAHKAIIRDAYYFKKRGDFSKNLYCKEPMEQFYEYALFIEKTPDYIYDRYDKFSYEYSQTYKQLNK